VEGEVTLGRPPAPDKTPSARRVRPAGPARRLDGLVDIAKVVSSAEAFEDVLRLTAAAARDALDAASVSISVWERDRGWVRVLLNVGDLGPGEVPEPVDEVYTVDEFSVVEPLFEHAQPYVQTLEDDPGVPLHDRAVTTLLRELGKGSCMGVPVVLEGRVWGELFATRYAEDPPFTTADIDYALAVAGQIAAGVAQVAHLERVARLAYTDPLTGLANRRAIDDRLDTALARHRVDQRTVSLVVVDVNGLKRINDDRGHDAGDRALVHVAGLLSAAAGLAPGSLAGRTGGDEFCVVLEGPDADVAARVAEDLCRRAAASLDEGVACGVASTGDPVGPVDTPARLFRLADAAQMRAKRSRSRRPVIAGRGLPDDATVRLADVRGSTGGDRRRVRSRMTADAVRVLDDVLESLDHHPHGGPAGRMEVIADTVTRLVDGSAWCVSHCAPSAQEVTTVTFSSFRTSVDHAEGLTEFWNPANSDYPLEQYPMTAAAIEGAGFVLDVTSDECDPAEQALLSGAGYTRNLMAGGRDRLGGGWLVEVFTDEISAGVDHLGPTLRALVAVALSIP
jgi:diguanylate cyclase (GGDEF)-like protein